MAEPVLTALAIAAIAGTGLNAGLFFAFSNFVMAALARAGQARGMAAIQAINITVLNPLFMLVFFGTGLLSLAVALAAVLPWGGEPAWTALIAAVLYNVGCVGVTLRCNVPLNNALAQADAKVPASADLWARYLREWTMWNHVRTIASLAASVLLVLSIL